MVKRKTMLGIITACVLIAASATGWIYIIPTITNQPVPAQQVVLNGALALHRERLGSEPRSLEEVEPFLNEFTNAKCSVAKIGADRYRVWLYLDGRRTDEFEVDYKLSENGDREVYNVHNIRKFHHRK
jgi:hypothetical protein